MQLEQGLTSQVFGKWMICKDSDVASRVIATTRSINCVTISGDVHSGKGTITGGHREEKRWASINLKVITPLVLHADLRSRRISCLSGPCTNASISYCLGAERCPDDCPQGYLNCSHGGSWDSWQDLACRNNKLQTYKQKVKEEQELGEVLSEQAALEQAELECDSEVTAIMSDIYGLDMTLQTEKCAALMLGKTSGKLFIRLCSIPCPSLVLQTKLILVLTQACTEQALSTCLGDHRNINRMQLRSVSTGKMKDIHLVSLIVLLGEMIDT